MQTGMTLRQFAVTHFYKTLAQYKAALESGDTRAIVLTSLKIHAAKSNVPKRLWPLVNRTYRESYRAKNATIPTRSE